MEPTVVERALTAATAVAAAFDLAVDDAVILNRSNRLVVLLTPCQVVARVSPMGWFSAGKEVEVAARLAAETDSPAVGLDPRVEPRVVARDGFEIALWTYAEPSPSRVLSPGDYADALERLHRALRRVDMSAPHVGDRLAEVQRWLLDGVVTPDLPDQDRELLIERLEAPPQFRVANGVAEQLLHGEPHPGNVLTTDKGPLFIDFENCACGPIDYDLAWVPCEVSERYSGADQELVGACRALVLALIAAHRWRRDDHHPSGGKRSCAAFLEVLRSGPPWPALDTIHW